MDPNQLQLKLETNSIVTQHLEVLNVNSTAVVDAVNVLLMI